MGRPDVPISSTEIRRLVAQGEISAATGLWPARIGWKARWYSVTSAAAAWVTPRRTWLPPRWPQCLVTASMQVGVGSPVHRRCPDLASGSERWQQPHIRR